jgi:hypothetical protein
VACWVGRRNPKRGFAQKENCLQPAFRLARFQH